MIIKWFGKDEPVEFLKAMFMLEIGIYLGIAIAMWLMADPNFLRRTL